LNVVDGCIPSDRATGTLEEIEEERRLLYVASTRAKDELDLIAPHWFFTHQQAKLGDRHVYESRSRFIQDSILGSFATRNWRDQTDSQIEAAGRKARSSVDVAASLMRMWR
jgi:DNA helicase II / ATP-dependent DNA helicase PcrA